MQIRFMFKIIIVLYTRNKENSKKYSGLLVVWLEHSNEINFDHHPTKYCGGMWGEGDYYGLEITYRGVANHQPNDNSRC